MIFTGLLSVLALGLATTVATPALAELPDSGKAEWQARYRSLLDSVSEAASRYEAAKAVYSKNRQINRKRGDARFDINTELSEAQIELADARVALEDFPEEARRAGVPPGWLREVEDAAGAAAPR
jgi:hypothetical protein